MSWLLNVFKLLPDLVALIKSAWEGYKASRKEAWLEKRRAITRQIRLAKTDEERANLIRRYNALE